MPNAGGCRCGQVRYEIDGPPDSSLLCHCRDCARSAGASPVAWIAIPEARLRIVAGSPTRIRSSADAERQFCPRCGTGLFYRNAAILPGIVDVQTFTLDDPAAFPPTAQMQIADRVAWVAELGRLPAFERWPTD